MPTYVLAAHAAQALGIRIDQLKVPRVGDGVSGDALWVDPRFIELRREQAAIAAQRAERRHTLDSRVAERTRFDPDDLRERKKLRAERRKAMRAASI